MRILLAFIFLSFSVNIIAQKKVMQQEDKALWNRINNVNIANSGDYVLYELEKNEKDQTLKLHTINGQEILSHDRSKGARFSFDSKYVAFTVNAWKDSITEMKRRKVKKKDFPKDTLVIYDIQNRSIQKVPKVNAFKMPEKWSGIIAYQLDIPKDKKKDTAKIKKKKEATKVKKQKKVAKDSVFHLVIRQLADGKEDTLKYIKKYALAKEGRSLTFVTSGGKDKEQSGVYQYDIDKKQQIPLFTSHNKTKYPQLNISKSGKHIGFVVDADSTKSLIKKPNLYAWKQGQKEARLVVASENNPSKLLVSKDEKLWFSKNENRLFFGLRTKPIVQDTTLLKEEIVNVEVWTYDEPRLYTVQELQAKNDKKKAYLSLYDFTTNKTIQIANPEYDFTSYSQEGNSRYAVISNGTPYQLASQWTGQYPMDVKRVDLSTGDQTKLGTKVYGAQSLSPKGKYLFGYSRKDSTWFTYNLKTLKYTALTKGKQFYNELHDYPDDPYSYGVAGWTEGDERLLIYDRFDIWSYNPDTGQSENLTNGRSKNIQYRYLKLDDEEIGISKQRNWLLSSFNEVTKYAGFSIYNPKKKSLKSVTDGPFKYRNPHLAMNDKKERIVFTKESFTEFPNLWSTDLSFKSPKKISDANPQQKEYNWGTAELVKWVSLDGKPLEGMLIKPENFDPTKKYPLIVNFYEKSSDNLYNHRGPSYGRSTINYSFYASRGYLIFNPDVHYRDGYPGESAFNCVIPGITALIEKGFVDKNNIGVQGHSWGGYQIAYLVTKTDIFKAAESGAPVPNMISAYGGIRWWSGLSRQFQYEHTQSRIGGTPWEYPQRYVENSPIFNIDKINTPLLIMHNDADGHVPWYQGIEFFVSLRRLGKPSWFLNYNGEPHWPLKMQNRVDFNIRMAQFFDYYLKGAPKPVWMDRGVPAIEKGINQGYEYIDEE
ncbi:S9 family peptidase [Aquimarina litoralis]|uniref:S9 family peptidase n=1 Tax=Aquimarina litoralis TaxID=584605 RepID=UPI001C58B4A4|nr:prolyl oligopeptidase family serine peptidase [Aquimarina litoralis]MBW1298992.1 prolyl oligopeptidase family serine peptidase [Aquimarina litoralis]